MHISQIKINSILGIKSLEFEAGQFTEVSGKNGQGKTSVLEAIKSVIQPSGHDATLLRTGEEKGEVVLVLDDGMQLSKRVTENSSPLDVRDADGAKVSKPAEVIKRLSDALSVNPVEFLHVSKKDRVKVLLETMPINLDVEKLAKLARIKVTAQEGLHALGVIELTRKQVYDDRTGTNRAVKEKDATINQLRLAMPDVPGDAVGNEDELRAQVEAATAAKDAELERIRGKLDGIRLDNQSKINSIKTATQAQIDEIRTETQRLIDEIKTAAQGQVDAINAKSGTDIAAIETAERDIEQKASQQRELTSQRHTDAVAPLNQTLESIKTNRSAHAKREQALDTIAKMEKELDDLTLDAANQTKSLEDIDQYKSDLLQSLPIPGLEVKDGEIFRHGVQFDRLNTAQQVGIAVEIAKLRAGELNVVCVDGLELLDSAAFEAFKEQVLGSGLQLIVSRVSDEEFQVKTE